MFLITDLNSCQNFIVIFNLKEGNALFIPSLDLIFILSSIIFTISDFYAILGVVLKIRKGKNHQITLFRIIH